MGLRRRGWPARVAALAIAPLALLALLALLAEASAASAKIIADNGFRPSQSVG